MTGTPESAVPDQSQSRGAWFLRRALLVAGGVSAIILLTRTPHLEPALSQMRAIAAAQGPTGMLGFGAAYVVAALLFVPGAALTTLAGRAVRRGLGHGYRRDRHLSRRCDVRFSSAAM